MQNLILENYYTKKPFCFSCLVDLNMNKDLQSPFQSLFDLVWFILYFFAEQSYRPS